VLVPRSRSALASNEDTVTVAVADLYDFLNRHMEEPMPELEKATTTRKLKRGWRKISMNLRVAEYDTLAKMAEEEERTPDQQAAYLLRQKLSDLAVDAIKAAYREAEDRRNGDWNGLEEEAAEDDPRIREAPTDVLGRGNAERRVD
jgi:hypothetical protein